jgi:large subunit ribosomal protein L10
MKREEKVTIVDSLTKQIGQYKHLYLTDIAQLNAADTSALRRACFEKDIHMIVVKNTLLKRALEKSEKNYDELFEVLQGSTSIMLSDIGNNPAKLIKTFRKKHDKPVLKGAYVEESVYLGDNTLDSLVAIKSKEELLGDIVALLQSPVKNVMSALQSGSNIIHGVLETLSEKN